MSFQEHRTFGGLILAGSLAVVATGAQAQSKTVPDAQIEANVLRQLATVPDLSTQNIQSTTVYGTVTLSGTVQTEDLRSKAENLAARADGVKKVVDQLTLGNPAAAPANGDQSYAQPATDPQQGGQLQSDGTYAPGPGSQPGPDPAQGNMAQAPQQTYGNSPNGNNDPNQPPPGYANGAQAYGQTAPPSQQQPYYSQNQPNQQPSPYYQQGPPPQGRQPMYGNGYAAPPQGGPGAGQQAGIPVTVPSGVLLQVRVNRGIDSNHIAPGTPFDGIVMNDVIAGGAVAIPRGASVQGVVVDAKKAGALKGQGELSLALNTLTLGGQSYPIASIPWDREGRDKTVSTVNSALGLGALGAIFGGVAGGGAGAAIGAAAGGAVGVAGSASTPGGRVIVPPESVLTFHLAQPAQVTTVSQQEMARLSYAAGPNPAQPGRRRYYSPAYGYYYGPYGPPPAYYRPY